MLSQANANPMMRAGMPCSGSDVHDLAAICKGIRRLHPR